MKSEITTGQDTLDGYRHYRAFLERLTFAKRIKVTYLPQPSVLTDCVNFLEGDNLILMRAWQ
jgi:hypothetical protein